MEDSRFFSAVETLNEWVRDLHLQKPDGSMCHSLLSDWREGLLIEPPPNPGHDFGAHNKALLDFSFGVFLVEHNWAAAFENESDIYDWSDGFSFRTPYDHCCFEFVLSGKRVCLITHFDNENFRISAFVRLTDGWLQPPLKQPQYAALASMLNRQFNAVGVALDASVAETEIIRVPEKLNRAREKRGKPPIFDYNVVRLVHRSRAAPLPEVSSPGSRSGPRLHLRRGHWRHYENHKAWVSWTLVGNPDLGFIEKHYRL